MGPSLERCESKQTDPYTQHKRDGARAEGADGWAESLETSTNAETPQNPQKTEKLKKPSRCPRSFERPLTVMFFTQPSSGSLATPSPALGGLQIPSGLVVQSCTSHPEEEELYIGTQFSHLSTAVDTSAAAACNAWCVRVCVFFFPLFF